MKLLYGKLLSEFYYYINSSDGQEWHVMAG